MCYFNIKLNLRIHFGDMHYPSLYDFISLSNNQKCQLRSTTRINYIETWNQLPVELLVTSNLNVSKSKLKLFPK